MQTKSDAKVKQLLVQAKDEELQARLNRLRKRIDNSDDDDDDNNNNNCNTTTNNNNINFDDSDDDDNNVGGEELRQRYSNLRRPIIPSNHTKTSRHHLTMIKNYFVDTMISEHLCFKTYRPYHLCY